MKSYKKVYSSYIWKLIELLATQGAQFAIQIILARLLMPSDFGYLAIILVIVNLANVFIQHGFSSSIIQKPNVEKKDLDTSFTISVFISITLYIIIYLIAPIISKQYQYENFTLMIRICTLTLIPGAYSSVLIAYHTKQMNFKYLFKLSFISSVISGVLGIIFAIYGLRLWSLIFQQLANSIFLMLMFYFTNKVRLGFNYDRGSSKVLISFGWKVLASSIIQSIYNDARTLIIGIKYSIVDLGYFNKANQFPSLIIKNTLNGALKSVIYPAFSKNQSNDIEKIYILRQTLKIAVFVMFPISFGLAVISRPLVLILLTSKWEFSIPYLVLFSIYYAFLPIFTTLVQFINSTGRSDVSLKINTISTLLNISILIVTIYINLYFVIYGMLISLIITIIILMRYLEKTTTYNFSLFFLDTYKPILFSIIMLLVTSYLPNISNILIDLLVKFLVGFLVYCTYIFFDYKSIIKELRSLRSI